MNKKINLSKYKYANGGVGSLGITATDNSPPAQVGVMLPGEKVVFHPQYSFLGTGVLDLHTRTRTMEICEAFAYISCLAVAIKWDGIIQIVKYDPDKAQFIK